MENFDGHVSVSGYKNIKYMGIIIFGPKFYKRVIFRTLYLLPNAWFHLKWSIVNYNSYFDVYRKQMLI